MNIKVKYIVLYVISIAIGLFPVKMGINMYNRDLNYYNETINMFPTQSIPDYSNIFIGIMLFILIQLIAVYIHIVSKIK